VIHTRDDCSVAPLEPTCNHRRNYTLIHSDHKYLLFQRNAKIQNDVVRNRARTGSQSVCSTTVRGQLHRGEQEARRDRLPFFSCFLGTFGMGTAAVQSPTMSCSRRGPCTRAVAADQAAQRSSQHVMHVRRRRRGRRLEIAYTSLL
jgi:hypothetical protein